MATISLASLARTMRQLDICMMVTQSGRGSLNSRPMSNNKDVAYKGDSYFFTYENSQKIKDLEQNPWLILNFDDGKNFYISISGRATLIRNKATFAKHWEDSLNKWFKQGLDTPGIVLIHVKGRRLQYWKRARQGEITLSHKK